MGCEMMQVKPTGVCTNPFGRSGVSKKRRRGFARLCVDHFSQIPIIEQEAELMIIDRWVDILRTNGSGWMLDRRKISTKSSATDKKVLVSMASKVEVNLVLPELELRCIDVYWDLTSHAAEMKTTSGDVWSTLVHSECEGYANKR